MKCACLYKFKFDNSQQLKPFFQNSVTCEDFNCIRSTQFALCIITKHQQFATDCNEVFARLRERFLFRFREFLLSPNNWAFAFFFLHDNGFGPFTRFRLCTNSVCFPKVDSFKQLSVICSYAAGSMLAWRRSLAFSREHSDGDSRFIALNAM